MKPLAGVYTHALLREYYPGKHSHGMRSIPTLVTPHVQSLPAIIVVFLIEAAYDVCLISLTVISGRPTHGNKLWQFTHDRRAGRVDAEQTHASTEAEQTRHQQQQPQPS
jgi:hypothetical protein